MAAHIVEVELVLSDIRSCLDNRFVGKLDLMVVNSLHLLTLEDEVGWEGIAVAWADGENRWWVIDRWYMMI
ncbi:hypothetical protein LINPERHAP1_LOCUS37692 [Linum perenne]